jgi:hypothetical protein
LKARLLHMFASKGPVSNFELFAQVMTGQACAGSRFQRDGVRLIRFGIPKSGRV